MSKSKKQLSEEKTKLEAEKTRLMALKADGTITKEEQAELDEATVALVGVEEELKALEEPAKEEPAKEVPAKQEPVKAKGYQPKPGQENLVHLKVTRGSKFDPETGERLAEPFVQTYSYSEWITMRDSFSSLGLTVDEVLWDPFGEATEMFGKKE